MYFKEGGTIGRVPAPALPHKLVHLGGTAWRTLHPVARLQQLVHVGQLDPRVRRHAVGGNLPEENAESPNVGLGGELVVGQAFRGRPLDGELCARMSRVGVVPDQASQAEVGHLDHVVLAD